MGNLQASPSSSTTNPEEKYDVFINFRGEIRDSFANNLREELASKHIQTFMDDQLPKGVRISQLFKIIEESKISIVIFSKDYGSSVWCLRELVKIMELYKINKQTVKPVFYGVSKSDVSNQTGSFEDSFVNHENNFPDEVQKWRDALKEASGILGWRSSVTRPDTKLVIAIVDDIYKKLTGDENISSPSDFEGLIGLDERIDNVKLLLCLHKTDVGIIGICGMGGIGKTTLAEAIFNQISGPRFGGVCLILNVKEKIERNGSECLQKDILSKVLNESIDPITIPQIIKKRLNQTRVFIVLDDVNDFRPLETLARRVGGLGQGSRIIITSRDRLVLWNCRVDNQNIYGVEKLNHHEALQLFCNNAFNQNQPPKDLRKPSYDIVEYAGGNPLALTVLGSSLRGSSLNQESKKVWESTVKKLRTSVDRKIFNAFKISYDELKDGEQGVFLDIACFLKGRDQEYVAKILDGCYDWLKVLINKSLITVSHVNTIEMHDLLQDFGREIVRKQSPTDPGKCSRLWAPKDVQHTLKNNAGTNAVEGIFLDMSEINDMHLSLEAFNKMNNLRLLKFYNSKRRDSKSYRLGLLLLYDSNEWHTPTLNKVHFQEGQNDAPPFDNMRSFIWFGYPLAALSSNFNLENLVELDLSCSSNFERLWGETKHAPKLKWLYLHDCPSLIEVPDLSKSPFLEKIDLGACSHLTKIQNLSNLAFLEKIDLYGCLCLTEIPDLSGSPLLKKIDLQGCRSLLDFPLLAPLVSCCRDFYPSGLESLRSFPSTIVLHYESHVCLDLTKCINLTTFPLISGNLERLNLSGTAIAEVPRSIENLIKLYHLNLSKCTRLKQISTNICKLKSLKELNLENCSQLESFPEISEKMEGLEFLNLSGTAIKELPHSIENLIKLFQLNLSECTMLKQISTNICKLKSLKELNLENCSQLESFPEILDKMEGLKILNLSGTAIKELPHSIENLIKLFQLNLSECKRLKQISTSICKLKSLKELNLKNCYQLESFPEILEKMEGLEILNLSGTAIKELPHSIEHPTNLSHLYLNNCNMLQSLTKLPSALKHLSAIGCKQLRSIPDASEFANLADADFIFTNCLNLEQTAVGNMLATLKEGYEEGDKIGVLTFYCPGSEVPEWLMYRAEGSIVELNFQMLWHDCFNGWPLLGFVVCAVIACKENCYINHDLRVYYNYRSGNGDVSCHMRIASRNGTYEGLDSDHIRFGFWPSVPSHWARERKFTNCKFEFWFSYHGQNPCRIKSCGVCPIYAKHSITLPSFKK